MAHTIPDSRTVQVRARAGGTSFSYPKDPSDTAWFQALFEETIATGGVTASGSGLTVGTVDDAPVAEGKALQFKLTGGTSNHTYTLTFDVVTTEGDTLQRSATLIVVEV